MYRITWHDKKSRGWSKSTASKEEALNTISVLFKRRVSATCKTDDMPDVCGAVW